MFDSPYLMLGAVLAVIGAFLAGNWHGHDAESKAWQVAIAAQKQAAADLMNKTKDANAKVVAALNARNAELESQNADQKDHIKGMQIANGRFIAATCGLFDKNGRRREGGENRLPADPAAAGGAAQAPLACLLPAGVLDALGDLLARADGSEADAVTGHAYAVGLGPLINGH
jgi:hypothetical protein